MKVAKIKKTVKRRATLLGIGFFVAFIILVVTSLSYVYQIRSLSRDEKKLESQLEELKEKEEELSDEISKLKDPDYIAKYAREKFFYTKDGEYVIKINDDEKEIVVDSPDDIKVYYLVGIALIFIGFIIFLMFMKNKKGKKKNIDKVIKKK